MKDVAVITWNEDGIGANIITYLYVITMILKIFIHNSVCTTPHFCCDLLARKLALEYHP